MNKKEIKAQLEDTIDALEIAHTRIDKLVADLSAEREGNRQIYQWYQDEVQTRQFYMACLRKLRYVMSLDIVQNGTHRTRNEYYRAWVQTVQAWLEIPTPALEKDDIPF